jgi:hypothetical protein
VHGGIWCIFVRELPPGRTEIPSSSGIVGGLGGQDFNLKLVGITGAIGVSIHAAERADQEREVGMKVRRRELLLLAALAAAGAVPAWGQTAVPAIGASSGAQGAASIPDFSGIWAHMTWPDFEPPVAGPGPVTNRSRTRDGIPNVYELVGDYSNPILKPHAAEIVKAHGEISLTGVPYPTPSNQCWPGGVPFVLFNIGMQMLQEPDKITILYSNDHEVRHVRMNQPHPAHVTPSWYGDSVGRYEGDTLVIDTVGVKSGPFAMADMYGTPHSPALHVVERYRLLDYEAAKQAEERGQRKLSRFGRDPGLGRNPDYKGQGLQLEFTVEDDGVLTTPWSAAISYRRPLGEWPEMACAENPDGHFGEHAAVPKAEKPDF